MQETVGTRLRGGDGGARPEAGAAGRLTVLQAAGKRLCKSYARDRQGRIVKRSYDSPLFFTSAAREFVGVDGLAGVLRELQRQSDRCVAVSVLPGKWHPGPGRPVLRRLHAAAELVDDRGRFHKPARKGAPALWQQREIEAGRLWPVTVLPMFEAAPTNVLLLDVDGMVLPAGLAWRDDLAFTAAYARWRDPSPTSSPSP